MNEKGGDGVGVGVGGDAPWGFGMVPHGGGNGEDDGGGGGFTLADCWPSCVCRFAGGGLTGSCTAAVGGDLTGGCAAGSNDGEGADCWEGGCLCGFAGGALTGMLGLMQQVNRGGEHLGGGEGFGLLGDGVGVGGDAPWCFGMGPHGGGNGEGDGGGGGSTLADCCPGCVCRFAGGRLTGSCTAAVGGALTGGCAAGSNDSEGAGCWERGCPCSFTGGCLTGMLGSTGMRGWHASAAGAQLLGPAKWPQITALPQINACSLEFEASDWGSEETQY